MFCIFKFVQNLKENKKMIGESKPIMKGQKKKGRRVECMRHCSRAAGRV